MRWKEGEKDDEKEGIERGRWKGTSFKERVEKRGKEEGIEGGKE